MYTLAVHRRIDYILFVPTTVHIPPELLARVDDAAGRQGISRNRFVIKACERAVEEDAGAWPEGFLDPLPSDQLEVLRDASQEMERAIHANRRNRGGPIL